MVGLHGWRPFEAAWPSFPRLKLGIEFIQSSSLDWIVSHLTERLAFATQNGRNGYLSLIGQFADTRRYLEQHCEDVDSIRIISRIDGKLRLLRGRSALPSSFFKRVRWILRSWKGYRDYARGPISMLKDSLFPSRGIASGGG